MRTQSYGDIVAGANDVLRLAKDLGLGAEAEGQRFARYVRMVSDLTDAPVSERVSMDTLPYLVALSECHELAGLRDFLPTCDPSVLKTKLRLVLRGPDLPLDEDTATSEARNTLFELSFGAMLWHGGLNPTLGVHPDLTCEIDGRAYFIECKRPFYRHSMKDVIGVARGQLARDLRSHGSPGTGAIIAISASKALNRGDKLLDEPNEALALHELFKRLRDLTHTFRRSYATKNVGEHVVGTIFHVITPAIDKGRNIYWAAEQLNFHPAAHAGRYDPGFLALGGRLRLP